MNLEHKREALKKAYPDKKWADKVDGMTDKQVTDTYSRLKSQDKV